MSTSFVDTTSHPLLKAAKNAPYKVAKVTSLAETITPHAGNGCKTCSFKQQPAIVNSNIRRDSTLLRPDLLLVKLVNSIEIGHTATNLEKI